MAEHVYSNYGTKCRGKLKCSCGTVSNLLFTPTPGSASQRIEGFQCPNCRNIVTLTVFGDGEISGTGVEQRRKAVT
jgi:hypothetical protein